MQSFTVPQDVGLEIARLADANGWELSTTVGGITYYRQRPGQALGQFAPGRAVVAANADAITDGPTRILVSDPDAMREILALWSSRLSGQCRIQEYTSKDGKSLGIFGLGATKGNALESVLQRLRISQSEVMAIGDDLNDLPMFSRARIKIAMGNAQPELKEQATAIAPSNDDGGVRGR